MQTKCHHSLILKCVLLKQNDKIDKQKKSRFVPVQDIFAHSILGNEMNDVLGHDFALERLYWAGDNLG